MLFYEKLKENLTDKSLTKKEMLWFSLDLCGCLDGTVLDDIWNIFSYFVKSENMYIYIDVIVEKLQLEYKYVHLILNILDSQGILEHGTSVRGSWIIYKIREDILKLFEVS